MHGACIGGGETRRAQILRWSVLFCLESHITMFPHIHQSPVRFYSWMCSDYETCWFRFFLTRMCMKIRWEIPVNLKICLRWSESCHWFTSCPFLQSNFASVLFLTFLYILPCLLISNYRLYERIWLWIREREFTVDAALLQVWTWSQPATSACVPRTPGSRWR